MSRSYKAPYSLGRSISNKLGKRFANRAVRNCADVPDGGAYTKLYESWDLCDYRFHHPGEPGQVKVFYRRGRRFITFLWRLVYWYEKVPERTTLYNK